MKTIVMPFILAALSLLAAPASADVQVEMTVEPSGGPTAPVEKSWYLFDAGGATYRKVSISGEKLVAQDADGALVEARIWGAPQTVEFVREPGRVLAVENIRERLVLRGGEEYDRIGVASDGRAVVQKPGTERRWYYEMRRIEWVRDFAPQPEPDSWAPPSGRVRIDAPEE